jgi:rhodanese-related sulfurtransferase
MKFREFKLRKDPKCPVCGEQPTVTKLIDYEEFCGVAPHQQPPVENTKLEEINATELNARRLRGDAMQVIDVREPHEFEIARIPGTKLIPLNHVVSRMDEIDPTVDTIVHCKGGVRSAKAIEALKRAGFEGRLINLKGGISAWSDEVDPRVAKY